MRHWGKNKTKSLHSHSDTHLTLATPPSTSIPPKPCPQLHFITKQKDFFIFQHTLGVTECVLEQRAKQMQLQTAAAAICKKSASQQGKESSPVSQ